MVNANAKRHNRQAAKKSAKSAPAAGRNNGARDRISGTMRVADVLALLPDAETLLTEYGIRCAGCSIGGVESLEEGCRLHGFEDSDIRELVEDLNTLLEREPARPQTLTLTLSAAKAIKEIMKAEGRTDEALLVTSDGAGSFCLEFQKEPGAGIRTFTHKDEPAVRIVASPLTLRRLGGSTIDYREKRFKLDLPEEK
jgi:hybrid cluster-associated redox disulfide protein